MGNKLPTIHFFTNLPQDFESTSPLVSSIQTLETAFILIGMERYPHALVSCASAIESVIKARKEYRRFRKLHELISAVQYDFPVLGQCTAIDEFRDKRNVVVHKGFSPRDDAECARLLLAAGLPFLSGCYANLFQFDLHQGLAANVSRQMRFAYKAFQQEVTKQGFNPALAFSVFGHLMRYSTKKHFMSRPESKSTDPADEDGIVYKYAVPFAREVEEMLKTSYRFTCPICSEDNSFVCHIDPEAIKSRIIRLGGGICSFCSLLVPRKVACLTNMLMEEDLLFHRYYILKKFGVEPDVPEPKPDYSKLIPEL